jgi:hypothetical protein
MGRKVHYGGGTVTLTDTGDLMCSDDHTAFLVAGKLAVFGNEARVFSHLEAQDDDGLTAENRNPTGDGDPPEMLAYVRDYERRFVAQHPSVVVTAAAA